MEADGRQRPGHETEEVTALPGINVLELATGVAGPYCGRLLSILGATVVKMEPPGGDPARSHPVDDLPVEGISPLYLHLNLGKRNVSLGLSELDDALDWADVVIDSRVRRETAGTALDPEILRTRHPGVLLAAVTAWGLEADEAGSIDDELLVQAASGLTTQTGDPGGPPLRLPGWQTQYLAGVYTTVAVLAALSGGERPHVIDVDWVSGAISGCENNLERFFYTGIEQPPAGPSIPNFFPAGVFACADGHVALLTARQRDWDMQMVLYGKPELADDSRFNTQRGRADNVEALKGIIQPWYEAHGRVSIMESALELGISLGMVLTASDLLLDHDARGRTYLADMEGPDGPFRAPARPFRMIGASRSAARVHGQGEDDEWFAEALGRRKGRR